MVHFYALKKCSKHTIHASEKLGLKGKIK